MLCGTDSILWNISHSQSECEECVPHKTVSPTLNNVMQVQRRTTNLVYFRKHNMNSDHISQTTSKLWQVTLLTNLMGIKSAWMLLIFMSLKIKGFQWPRYNLALSGAHAELYHDLITHHSHLDTYWHPKTLNPTVRRFYKVITWLVSMLASPGWQLMLDHGYNYWKLLVMVVKVT